MKPVPARARQGGGFVVEFALVAMFFFTLVFTIIEVARALYLFNTLQEVTRRAARAAANTDPKDTTAINAVKLDAVFGNAAGTLVLGAPITTGHIKIDYLSLQRQAGGVIAPTVIPTGALPNCPARNRLSCTADSGSAACVRLVRVRLCDPAGGDCAPVRYQSLLPLVAIDIDLPTSAAIVKAESLGYSPGSAMCN